MRRELRSVGTERLLGAVDDQAEDGPFIGEAGRVLRPIRRRHGDAETVRMVLDSGWSNGYIYFTDPV